MVSYWSEYRLCYNILIQFTTIFSALATIIVKRSAYLIASGTPSKTQQAKICIVYVIAIFMEWILVKYLIQYSNSNPLRCRTDKILFEVLMFEILMLEMRFILGFLKFTLSLWCLYVDVDFRIKFYWFSLMKNIIYFLSFMVIYIIFRFTYLFLMYHH